MPFTPIFAIVAPLIGLLILLPTAWLPLLRPYRRFLTPAAVGLSFIGVLFTPLEPAYVVPISRWHPSILFGAFPALLAGQEVWPLAMTLSCAALASTLMRMSRSTPSILPLEIATLWMLAAGLGGLWGENLLTVLIAWAGFDLAWGLGAAAAGLPAHRVALGAGMNGLATVLLWAGGLATDSQGSISWRLADLGGMGGELLLLAALLRLGVYPLHLSLPAEDRWNLPESVTLLMGPLLGWGLLVHLVAAGGGELLSAPWTEGIAMATFVGGGLLAWFRTNRGGGWPWASLIGVGGMLWATLHAGDSTLWALTAGGTAWALGVTLLHLDRGLDRSAPWWSAGAVVGGMSLLGAPLTPGLLPSTFLLETLVTSPTSGRILTFLLGHGLLTAAIIRRTMRNHAGREEHDPLHTAARAAGITLPSAVLLTYGTFPSPFSTTVSRLVQPGAAGWGLWTAGIVVGALLTWYERRFRKRVEPLLGLLYDMLRLEWVIRLLLRSLNRLSAFLGAMADVAEGPGAILWALSIFFLILLAIVGH